MPSRRQRKQHPGVWVPPPSLLRELEKEGADPRISKSGARFNAAVARCLGVPCRPLDDESVKFINAVDSVGKALAKANGHELIDD